MSRIDVDPHNWGVAQISDIEAVLKSTLACFESGTGMAIGVNIRVKHSPDVPRTLYRQDPDGRTVILLSAQDLNLCQYIYQLIHELCHVATTYNCSLRSPEFYWLAETICELASWTTL